jgi:hypothetical protein
VKAGGAKVRRMTRKRAHLGIASDFEGFRREEGRLLAA